MRSRTFRSSLATHRIEAGYDIRTVQESLEHADVSTITIGTHVLQAGGRLMRLRWGRFRAFGDKGREPDRTTAGRK